MQTEGPLQREDRHVRESFAFAAPNVADPGMMGLAGSGPLCPGGELVAVSLEPCRHVPEPPRSGATRVSLTTLADGTATRHGDWVAVEEPLEIQLEWGPAEARVRRTLAVTLRTPTGHDAELAAGFLFAEGLIRGRDDLEFLGWCGRPNTVVAVLRTGVAGPLTEGRRFLTSSSCGVCGRTTLDDLALRTAPLTGTDRPVVEAATVHRLPALLRTAQAAFEQTGGLHAAALFTFSGQLELVREDVGRHNALDKLIGAELLAGRLPLHERVLLVSGRVGFELTQKAVAAGIPVLAAVGAPSSLAVELAERFGLTLIGFVRDHRFNVYTHPGRLNPD